MAMKRRQANGKQAVATGVRMRHCGLVVADIDAARAFYTEVLGFPVVADRLEAGPVISTLLGRRGTRVRTVKMAAGPGMVLELLQFPGVKQAQTRRWLTTPGYTHIAFTVKDLTRLCRKLKKRGNRFVSRPLVSPDGRVAVCFCRDDEGNYLELVEERENA